MGIYDREYYRREGPSYLGKFTEHGQVCKYLIIVNIVVFVAQLVTRNMGADVHSGGPVTDALILDVDEVLNGQIWRLLTYAFLHAPNDVWHILFNMLFLWWFGSDVEDLYGPREFLAVYLVSAVAGGVAFVVGHLAGVSGTYCLGASGAVTAVLVLCALHYPTRVIMLFFLLPVPIWLFVIFSVARDAYALLSNTGAGTAVGVHVAGAAFAFVYFKRQWRLMSLWPNFRSWRIRRNRPRLRVYHEDEDATPVTVAAPASSPDVDEHLEAKLDAVLEKVSRTGKDSLTESEQKILQRASEIYRKRRS